MNDENTIIVIESINLNSKLDAGLKLDLIRETMLDTREKQVGKILMDVIQKPVKKKYPLLDEGFPNPPKKRGRGRPRKDEKRELSENAKKMIKSAGNGDASKE